MLTINIIINCILIIEKTLKTFTMMRETPENKPHFSQYIFKIQLYIKKT